MRGSSSFRYLTRLADITEQNAFPLEDLAGAYEQHDRETEDALSRARYNIASSTTSIAALETTVTSLETSRIPAFDLSWQAATTLRSTSSTTFVNFPDTLSVTIVKQQSSTSLLCWFTCTCFTTNVNDIGRWAVGDGVTTSEIAHMYFNTANEHTTVSGFIPVTATGTGTKTITVKWRVDSAGMVLAADGQDTLQLLVMEARVA